jgi:TRAP transporter TAXI family solute receptor
MAELGPRLDLKIVGDWGNANFHTIVGWIAANVRWRSAPGSTFWIKTGTGYRDNIEAVAKGEVDLGITTPLDVTLEWAREGREFFAGTAFPKLRTLGYFPQDDRLVLAVRADTGITSFKDIRDKKYPLKIATTCHDPDNMMTWVVDMILRHHGIEPSDIDTWGGAWLEHDHPRKCLPQAIRGEANAVFNEGIMVPQWYELIEKVPMRFIPFEQQALDKMKQIGLRPAVLPKGKLKADRDIPCLDWSHWAVIVRDDMSADVAYRIASVMVEERAELEARFRHLPPERSPMTYPVDPYKMWQGIGAPLHPGAERYYREHGYMK